LKEITNAMQRSISDKRGGTATTENEIGLPRMDSLQNPCSESFLCPGSATPRSAFPAPLPSVRGKFMANCFNRRRGTTWCTKYTDGIPTSRKRTQPL